MGTCERLRVFKNIVLFQIGSFLYFNFAGKWVTAFFDLFWWIHLKEEEDSAAPLTSARRTYNKFFAQDDGGQIPSNYSQDRGPIPSTTQDQFGRGQLLSSVSTGWKPKPIGWKLLGGAGGNTKKTKPKTKAQESHDGN